MESGKPDRVSLEWQTGWGNAQTEIYLLIAWEEVQDDQGSQ